MYSSKLLGDAYSNKFTLQLCKFLPDHQCKQPHVHHDKPHISTMSACTSSGAGTSGSQPRKPSVIITIGMAGAGKSTFVQRINSHLHTVNPSRPPYILNLDPAVTYVPFEPNIDIRDTVNYKEVMKQCVAVSFRGPFFHVTNDVV